MAEAWGVWGEKSKEGRTYEGIIRSSFLVDADGRIREAWYQVAPEGRVPFAVVAFIWGACGPPRPAHRPA